MSAPAKTALYGYWLSLVAHDWQYVYSDDPLKFQQGARARRELEQKAKEHQDYAKLFYGFLAYNEAKYGPYAKNFKLPKKPLVP